MSVIPRRANRPVQAEDGTGASSSDFGAVFVQTPIGMAVLDQGGRIIDINAAFLGILAAGREAVVGQSFFQFTAAGDRDEVERQLAKLVLGTGRVARVDAVSLVDGEGRRHLVVLDATGYQRGGDLCGLILTVCESAPARARADAALIQAQKMQAVGQLAGGIAHDFNNLLTAMIGFSDLLLIQSRPDEPAHEEVVQIRRNALRAVGLVRQLLAFSRQQALTPKVLDPAAAIGELSLMLRRLLGPAIELRLELCAEPLRICVDPVHLDQVIMNLAINARDAMPNGGVLTIRTGMRQLDVALERGLERVPAGQYVAIEVVDTGSGIAADVLPSIFEPFFTTKAVGEGTGLGLATVHGIVRQSNGFIFAESSPCAGASFSVYLPPALGKAAKPPTSAMPYDLTQGPLEVRAEEAIPATVLLVDDEPGVRAFTAKALRRCGYQVLDAGDGEEALALVQQTDVRFDLLISDVVMPKMDGRTLACLLDERQHGFAVILMSGYAEDVLADGGAPAHHFLMKPFSLSGLIAKVSEVLDDSQSRAVRAAGRRDGAAR